MFLHRAEIPAERLRVKLGDARTPADGLGDLPDAVPFMRTSVRWPPFVLNRETKSGSLALALPRTVAM
jgi:hypothetical protein